MKTKNLIIIFILFLLITLASGLVVFLTEEKNQPVLSEQPGLVEKPVEPVPSQPDKAVAVATSTKEKTVQPKKVEQPPVVSAPTEEKIQAVMLINGVEYRTAIKPNSSVYDLMEALKQENKINFSGKNYSDLGFFVEEINGLKNDPAGKNWLYYVNGQPAQVGVSNYLIKAGDIIEWKYEAKSF